MAEKMASGDGCAASSNFYLRFYVGHKSPRFGHEFMEFEVSARSGKLRYANGSQYRSRGSDDPSGPIRKEVFLRPIVIDEIQRIIKESGIYSQDDAKWPEPCSIGCQELEIVNEDTHLSFTSTKIGSLHQVQQCKDPEGFAVFYYLVQDLKCFLLSLISLHYKVKPIPV